VSSEKIDLSAVGGLRLDPHLGQKI